MYSTSSGVTGTWDKMSSIRGRGYAERAVHRRDGFRAMVGGSYQERKKNRKGKELVEEEVY